MSLLCSGCGNKLEKKLIGNTFSYTDGVPSTSSYVFKENGEGHLSYKSYREDYDREQDFTYKIDKDTITVFTDKTTKYFTYEDSIDCLIDKDKNTNYCKE